jgi:hypothetical protein
VHELAAALVVAALLQRERAFKAVAGRRHHQCLSS